MGIYAKQPLPLIIQALRAGYPLSEDLTDQFLGSVFPDQDVLPVKAVPGDVGENPESIVLVKHFAHQPVSFLLEGQPLHARFAGAGGVRLT